MKSKLLCSDNLPVLKSMDDKIIDLIYLDPPFNKGKQFYAPVGSKMEGTGFTDIFREEDIKVEWYLKIKELSPVLFDYLKVVEGIGGRSVKNYLTYIAVRLIEMHRVLKDTGSIYLHCDSTASHYLKILLDGIFGKDMFKNEVIWCYKGASGARKSFPSKYDCILFYARSEKNVFNFDAIRVPYKGESKKGVTWNNVVYEKHPLGTKCLDWFSDIPSFMTASQSKERTGYPTQKPQALLERIIKASSNEAGMVLDPFCGSGTTCVAANRLKRNWIGIDINEDAIKIAKTRILENEERTFL